MILTLLRWRDTEMKNNTTLSIAELAQVRINLDKILDELQLDAYIYAVEPQSRQWQLTIECATENGWETVKFSADEEYLLRGVDDAVVHDVLIDGLREALCACRLKE